MSGRRVFVASLIVAGALFGSHVPAQEPASGQVGSAESPAAPEPPAAKDVVNPRRGATPTIREKLALAAHEPIFGPFPIRAMDTMSLLFYQAPAAAADTLPAGSWKLSFDTFLASFPDRRAGERFEVQREHEFFRFELGLEWGITDDLELQVIVPFHFGTRAFLDDLINEVHRITDSGPTDLDRDVYLDRLLVDGQVFHETEEDLFSIADIPIYLKYSILKDRRDAFGLSVRAGLELPTGSESRGVGNGELDGGLGILLQKSFRDWTFFFGGNASFQRPPNRFDETGVRLHSVTTSGYAAFEWRILRSLALIGQFDIADNLLSNADTEPLTDPRATFAFGLRFRPTDRLMFQLALVEDAVNDPAADVLFLGGASYRF